MNWYSLEFELPLVSFILIALLAIVYFSKKKIHLLENKAYEVIIFSSLISSGIDTFVHIIGATNTLSQLNSTYYVLIDYMNKIISTCFVIVFCSLLSYILIISYKRIRNNPKNILIGNILFISMFFITTFFTHVKIIEVGTVRNVTGTTISLGYLVIALLIGIIVIFTLKNFNKKDKRYYTIFLILCMMGLLYFISLNFKGIIIYDLILLLLCYIMFFTIENPDVKMIEQLELARNQADKANKAKTEFLSNMSHEIRTPLNAIVGFSECMIEYPDLNEEVRNYAKDIVEASNSLLEIVNGILDISKIEANKMDIIPKDYCPREIFYSLEKLIKPRIGDKPIEFKSFISSDIPGILNGDVSKLKQIIINILTNAAKYTEKGEIIFNVSCVNKLDTKKCTLFISVKDTGRGIKKENIAKLFNKFERLDEDKNTTMEGTGLGLAITKRLVELLGGKINVFSEYGKGSKFTIYLEQDIINMEEPKKEIKETKINYEIFRGKKVLVVDDSSINLKVATQVLKPYNFELTTAISGFEAIEKVKEQNFDLILMDIMMPKMDGIETLKKLKENAQFKTPTVALTADAIEGMDAKYINEGFNDYLSKPINKEELNRVLNKYLKGN
jgi:signal transduction histidine kinase